MVLGTRFAYEPKMVGKATKVVYHIRSGYSNGSGNSSSMLSYSQTLDSFKQRIRNFVSVNKHLAKELSAAKEKNRRHGQTGQRYTQISTLYLPRIKAWLEENSTYIRKLEANHAKALELMIRILNPSAKLSLTVYLEAEANEDNPRRQLKPPGTTGHKYFTMPAIPEVEEEGDGGAGPKSTDDLCVRPRRSSGNVTQRKRRSSRKDGKKQVSDAPAEAPISNMEQEPAALHGTSKDASVLAAKGSTLNEGPSRGEGSQLPAVADQQATQRKRSGPPEGGARRRGSNDQAVHLQPDGKVPITERSVPNNTPLQVPSCQPILEADRQVRQKPQALVRAMPSHLRTYAQSVKPQNSASKLLQCLLARDTQKGGSEITTDEEKEVHKGTTQDTNHAAGATVPSGTTAMTTDRRTATPGVRQILSGTQDTTPEIERAAPGHIQNSHTPHLMYQGPTRTSIPSGAEGTSTDVQAERPKSASHNGVPSKRESRRSFQRRSSFFRSTNEAERQAQPLDGVRSSELKETDRGRLLRQEAVDVLSVITNTGSPRRRVSNVEFSPCVSIVAPSSVQAKDVLDLSTVQHAASSTETNKAQHPTEKDRPRTSSDEACEPSDRQQRPRRAAKRLSYKEPNLNTKLRRP